MSAMEEADLLADIKLFLDRTGMGPTYFGKVAGNNSKIVANLERGGTVTLRTAEKLRQFIRENSREAAE